MPDSEVPGCEPIGLNSGAPPPAACAAGHRPEELLGVMRRLAKDVSEVGVAGTGDVAAPVAGVCCSPIDVG